MRSPGEHAQGRLPGAFSLPLFTNCERAEVGTVYKKVGKQEAFELGLKIVGPKLASFVAVVKEKIREAGAPMAKVHCWRGGMRSGSMALLLAAAGIPTVTLKGGYKSFRSWCLQILEQPKRVIVLGGMTGSGKTQILSALAATGEQVIDLEHLADHRGSAYGKLGSDPQPSNEQFENDLAVAWAGMDPSRRIWLEDESRLIGGCKIPDAFFAMMREAPLVRIERPLQERLEILRRDYMHDKGSTPEMFVGVTRQIQKKLGAQRTQLAVDAIQAGDYRRAGEIVLEYYDRCYRHSLAKRPPAIAVIDASGLNDAEWASRIKEISCRTS